MFPTACVAFIVKNGLSLLNNFLQTVNLLSFKHNWRYLYNIIAIVVKTAAVIQWYNDYISVVQTAPRRRILYTMEIYHPA